jgi:hypothetical protein
MFSDPPKRWGGLTKFLLSFKSLILVLFLTVNSTVIFSLVRCVDKIRFSSRLFYGHFSLIRSLDNHILVYTYRIPMINLIGNLVNGTHGCDGRRHNRRF